MHRALDRLRGSNPAIRRVAISWFLLNLAEWAYVTVLAIHGYREQGALAVGLIGARFAPGALLGSALLGPLSRLRPVVTLRAISVARGALVAAAGVAVGAGAPLAVIVAIVWADAVIATPYRPVQAGALPALAVSPGELSAAAGGVPVAKALAQAAGALLGSIALAAVAADLILFVAAATVVLTAMIVARVRPGGVLQTLQAPSAAMRRHARFGAIGSGFRLIAQRARPLLLLGGTRSMTRGLWTSLTVVVSLRLLHLGSAGVGVLMAAAGVGAAVAVPLSLRFAGRKQLAGPAALTFGLTGLSMLAVGAIPAEAPAVVAVVVWGIALVLADSISNSLIHRVVEAQLLAPSVAAVESSKLLLEGLGALLGPVLLSFMGIRDAVLIAGAPLPLLVLASRGGLKAIDVRARARARPLSAIRRVPAFRGLTMLAVEDLGSRLRDASAVPGESIVRQGDSGDRFYLIDKGRVEVDVDGYAITTLGPGESFGDKALLREVPRTATVTALDVMELWYLERADFIAAVTGYEGPVAHRAMEPAARTVAQILEGVPVFGEVDRRALAAAGADTIATAGERIVGEGETGDAFYLLLAGEAQVTIEGHPVRTLAAGDWFGEIALLHGVPRTATVTAIGSVRLWRLGRDDFRAALGRGAQAPATLGR